MRRVLLLKSAGLLTGLMTLCIAGACTHLAAAEELTIIPPLESQGEYVVPEVLQLSATTLRVYEAPEADQGVAVDETYFYPVDNSKIGKYRRDTGELVARFMVPRRGLLRHMNSCKVRESELWCANSNYSMTPMGSSVEIFDTASMTHKASHSLGMMDEGSLTWIDQYRGGHIAGFAHYSGNGGLAFKDHTFASVVTFDTEWRRTGGWLFPPSVVERMAPYAASGGALGPDGLLYILGHDLPEMYVLARPQMGPALIHVATISVEAEGQAFSFAPGEDREVLVIDRRKGLVRQLSLPEIGALPADARTFAGGRLD